MNVKSALGDVGGGHDLVHARGGDALVEEDALGRALAVLGAADMISVYVRQSLVQIVTPDSMRGRVSAVSGLFISGSAELGEFETGVVARLLGPVGAAVFGGVGSLLVTGAWAWMFPSLRDADRLDGDPELSR